MRFILMFGFFMFPLIFLLIIQEVSCQQTPAVNISTVSIYPYRKCYEDPVGSFYDYEAMDLHESETINLSRYSGKQEPGSNGTEIMNCVRWVRPGNNFNPGFQFFHKIQVNGGSEHPLYTFLKNSCPPTRDGFRSPITDLYYKPIRVSDVRWNFEKFLVDHRGTPIYRFDATTEPADIDRFISEALDNARMDDPDVSYEIGPDSRYSESRGLYSRQRGSHEPRSYSRNSRTPGRYWNRYNRRPGGRFMSR